MNDEIQDYYDRKAKNRQFAGYPSLDDLRDAYLKLSERYSNLLDEVEELKEKARA